MYIKNVFFTFPRSKVAGVGLNPRLCIRLINDVRSNVMSG